MLERKRSRRVRPVVAVALQCVPLLAAGGCTANALTNQQAQSDYGSGWLMLALVAGLFWGLGYAYLGKWARFVALFFLGPVFALTSCTAMTLGLGVDYEHTWWVDASADKVAAANRANLQEALILGAAVLFLAVDAWRLAAAHNALAGVPAPNENDREVRLKIRKRVTTPTRD